MMKHALTALALLTATPGFAAAEVDGTLGASSTGSLKLSLDVREQNRIQISGFTDMVQTVESGTTGLEERSNGRSPYIDDNGNSGRKSKPCISTDLAGEVSIDWSVSPLTDGVEVIPFRFYLYGEATGTQGNGGSVIGALPNTLTGGSGSFSGHSSKAFGTDCVGGQMKGRLAVEVGHDVNLTVNRPGTYVSTISFTVRPG